MIRKFVTALVLLGAMPLAVAQHVEGASRALIVKLKPSLREGKLLTSLEQDFRQKRLASVAASGGFTATTPWRAMGPRVAVLHAPSMLKPEAAKAVMAKMLATGEVEWAEPSVRQKLLASSVVPNDPFYSAIPLDEGQWWLTEATTNNSDSQVARQRGAANINVAWETTRGVKQSAGSRVVIAVLDTGHSPHADIDPAQILPGRDFVSEATFDGDDSEGRDADPTDPGDYVTSSEAGRSLFRNLGCGQDGSSWHGLGITGVLAALSNNGTGVASVNHGARILPVRVAGKCGADLIDIIDGMRWAAGLYAINGVYNPNPAKIVNISFGGNGACGPAYQDAINDLRAHGVVVVAAGGNEHGAVSRPANCTDVISVAALNREGFKSTYSNFGERITVSTPGGDPGSSGSFQAGGRWGSYVGDTGILTTFNNSPTTFDPSRSWYFYLTGTSFATPIVSGVISLMLDENPNLTPAQIEDGLRRSARPHVQSSRIGVCSPSNPGRCICTTATCGAGILDAAEAVRFAAALLAGGSYSAPMRSPINIDSAQVIAAVNAAPTDRDANTATTNGSSVDGGAGGGGGGGGAVDPLTLLAGAGMALWLLAARWFALTSRRTSGKALARR